MEKKAVGKWPVGGELRVLTDHLWMLEVNNFSVRGWRMILLMAVLMGGREKLVWEEKEKYKIRAVQMENLRFLMKLRRIDGILYD